MSAPLDEKTDVQLGGRAQIATVDGEGGAHLTAPENNSSLKDVSVNDVVQIHTTREEEKSVLRKIDWQCVLHIVSSCSGLQHTDFSVASFPSWVLVTCFSTWTK